MNKTSPDASSYAWPLAALAIAGYAGAAIAIWAVPPGQSAHWVPWALCLYAAGLVGATGFWRMKVAVDQGQASDPRALARAALAPSLAVLACAAAPWIGFRWAFALLVAALSVQSLLDVGGAAMPPFFRKIRAAVSAAGLICLLIGLLGS